MVTVRVAVAGDSVLSRSLGQEGISMSVEENKALVRRCWEECFNQGNLAVVDELVAPSYIWHGPGQDVSGREGIKQLISLYRAAFPDLHMTFEDQIAEGDKVASRWTTRGTHTGDLLGSGPTGKQGTMTGIVISRLASNTIAEEWENFDQLGLLQQLGVMPRP
jgi:predicted ester cyclase